MAQADPAEPDDRAAILYIEDSSAASLLVEHLLRPFTHLRLVVAHEARLGIAAARSQRFALILTDLNLPDLSGSALLTALAADPATRSIPICIVSAEPPGRWLDQPGIVAHLPKPFRPGQLTATVARALGWPSSTAGAPPGGGVTESTSPVQPSPIERLQAHESSRATDIVGRFAAATSAEMTALRRAVGQRDQARIRYLAHRLTGTLDIFGAPGAARSVERLARAAASGLADEIEGALASAEAEVERFLGELPAGSSEDGR